MRIVLALATLVTSLAPSLAVEAEAAPRRGADVAPGAPGQRTRPARARSLGRQHAAMRRSYRSYERELDVARTLARAAGAVAMKHRGKVAREKKDGGEVVTAADREASALIVEALEAAFPGDLVVSEESKDNWDKVADADRVWFVDPIDGTKEYVEGTDGFAVQIALVEKSTRDRGGRPVLGVVYQPSLDRMYFAAPGLGAKVEESGGTRPLAVSATAEPARMRLLVSNMNRSKYLDEFKGALGIHGETPMGSVGIKLGFIARGEQDITFKPSGEVKAWDIAAPHAILEAAGGRFTTMEGEPFRYDRIRNAGGLLATNGPAHDDVVQRLAPIYREVMVKKAADDQAKAARKALKPGQPR